MSFKMYSVRPEAVDFDWGKFKQDNEWGVKPTLKSYVDTTRDAAFSLYDTMVKEMDDLLKEMIDDALEEYEYEAYTIEKVHPSLPALITLYPSEKELMLFGVDEQQNNFVNGFNIKHTYKIRVFDGYDEVYKGLRVYERDIPFNLY
ncbi:hypothetical protein [Bacillus thuringiensis]|uniref:hypothetical protein n=1 Tax=Bacillus thuringiensis TaxID=1428 RepID=UPI000A3786F2|nr:hypothetical protein [Bacillus thuringiensis]OTZ58610.1 hypothetical protein BK762_00345 [Bacillus thuringiensis serovar toumanoffi]